MIRNATHTDALDLATSFCVLRLQRAVATSYVTGHVVLSSLNGRVFCSAYSVNGGESKSEPIDGIVVAKLLLFGTGGGGME